MAGRPLRLALHVQLAKLGGPEFVYAHVANGGSIAGLATQLGMDRAYVSRQLNADPEYRKVLDEARRESAEVMAEDSLKIADALAEKPDLTSQDVAAAKQRIDTRKWFAAINHPDRFAPKDKAITISIGDMHLDALRKVRVGAVDAVAIDVTGDDDE
jgi:hypothetical protein